MDRTVTKLLISGVGLGLLFAGGNWVKEAPGAGALTWLAGLSLFAWGLSLFGGGAERHA
jgi:hypothetical protein